MRERTRQGLRRRRALSAAAALAIGVVTPGFLSAPQAAAARPDSVQRSLDALVRDVGTPAALASVRDRNGRTRTYTAGVGDLATGAPVPVDGQVRIGSNTKTFVAVVVLQLVAERRVDLDASVDTYLPGLVRGEGIDGRRITVRRLLQQTSGLPDYSDYLGDDVRYYAPRELLATALRHPADFAPGTSWKYSNTNYVLAGLLVQEVTGRPLAEEIDRRVVRPAGLRHTYFPAPGDASIREPHPHGYYRESADAPLRDVTEIDPSWGWAAGQMVSTGSDLNRFLGALLAGRLLPPAQLTQMRSTVPAEATFGPGARYGLGLVSRPLPCGGLSWGHGGSFPGYETRGGVTDDGRAANVAVTVQLTDEADRRNLERAVDTALCR
ncbi:serine hydrolase domain-containing protein [Kitasatospora phosalacinea]|uniref:serine hydrolase domain-containing protein n=1 Tax=Kitasatospora phosalacinea TaxID=2065 RepID=UPI000525FCDB|nr:serine hydrolase domain-containing protein [Kitasatospora phosalacinea]